MKLKPGMEVKLISFEQYQTNGPTKNNHNKFMKKYFGTKVIIKSTLSNSYKDFKREFTAKKKFH